MSSPEITILTPTIGSNSLFKLIDSLDNNQSVPFVHILLWDDKRVDKFLYPNPETLTVLSPDSLNSSSPNLRYSIVIPGSFIQGQAYGSALRSIGLLAAQTPFVTFLDDDCWIEPNHLSNLLKTVENHEWAYCRRKIFKNVGNSVQYLGVDNFESVGDALSKKVPYEMVDNNCMIFSRRFGSSGAVIYREVTSYSDDRQFYAFLKKHAGQPGKSELATINQVCPKRLEEMFEKCCAKE